MAIELYEDVLTKEQIKELLEIRDRSRVDSKGVIYFAEIRDRVMPYFDDFFSKWNIRTSEISGKYYFTRYPFSVHSDGLSSNLGEKQANINIFVPLDLEPAGSTSQTIFFDQLDETPNHGRKFYKHTIPDNGPSPIELDYSALTNLTDEPFDKKTYYKYLSYMDHADLYGLSFHRAVEWKIGDAIKFESNRLHCSASFKRNNLITKTHLFFKVYIPE